MRFSELEGRRVAVWGHGREGRAALSALRARFPGQPITVFCTETEAADVDPFHTAITFAPDADALAAFDVVIKSPGISAYTPELVAASARGTRFTSGTALWFGENPDARVVGITGTKGKSTTSAMLAHLARSLGIRTALAGNIGMPLLELDGQHAELWVIELSSFQTGETGPLELGVITSLYQEHLDWHGSPERYVTDKLKLADAARTLLVNATQPQLLAQTATHPHRENFGHPQGWRIAPPPSFPRTRTSVGRACPRPDRGMPKPNAEGGPKGERQDGVSKPSAFAGASKSLDSRLRGNDKERANLSAPLICRGGVPVMPLSDLPVPGTHNALNACAALAAIEIMGHDAIAAAPALANFHPLPHRLQVLGTRDGKTWINDSIATTPPATLAALQSLPEARVALIVGGYDRGVDWTSTAQAIATLPLAAVLAQGGNGARIADALAAAGSSAEITLCADLATAVAAARHLDIDTVLLSPGAASFDQFHDYIERGRRFAHLAGFDASTIAGIGGLGIA